MCIIVAVPRDVDAPSVETLETCFRSNPDGAGFMWADGKRVRIRKGFMTFEEFINAVDEECIPKGSALVMHFRIATHGKVQPCCCHPFPVSSEPEDLRATAIDARFGVAHNGVISGRKTNESWSDSMDFICDVIAPLSRICPGFINNSNAQELLEGACQSKLAIMDNAGDLMLVGGFHEDGGVFYSNTSYLPVAYNWSSYRSVWDGWDSYYGKAANDKHADIEKLIEMLPYDACSVCDLAGDCAMWEPECTSEEMALEACSYYSDMEEGEVAELIGIG